MSISTTKNTVILLAAGKGTRMREAVQDKILAPLVGQNVFRHGLRSFLQSQLFSQVVLVYRDDEQKGRLSDELQQIPDEELVDVEVQWVVGGQRRQDSVFNGLTATGYDCDYVFIHDCARPLIQIRDLHRLYKTVLQDKAASMGRPVTDTIKRVRRRSTHFRKCALEDLDRRMLWAMETPQCFAFETIFEAYRKIRQTNRVVTDDTAVASVAGLSVSLVEPTRYNLKITHPDDLLLAEFLLSEAARTARERPENDHA